MSTPVLRVEWPGDGKMPTVECGARVRGRVIVEHDEPLDLRSLTVGLGWHTTGRGDRDTKHYEKIVLHEGERERHRSFEFELELPAGAPPSFKGKLISLHWHLHVKLDRVRGRDGKLSQPFRVEPSLDRPA